MATQASAITFLSTPGQAYNDGMGFVQFYFGLPFAMLLICLFFILILTLIFLIIIFNILLSIDNNQKTSFRYFKWTLQEVSIGKLISISFFSGLFVSTLLNTTITNTLSLIHI